MNQMNEKDFYTRIARYYEKIFPVRPEPVNFVLSELPGRPGLIRVLDIGCSTGQMSRSLAERGLIVTGIDLDPEMIRTADINSEKSKARPFFRVGTMTELQSIGGLNYFDGIICLGNTLPHLTERKDLRTFFSESYSSLKQGGKLMIQMVNYDPIVSQNKTSLPTIDNEEIRFSRNYIFTEEENILSFNTALLIKSPGQIIENSVKLRAIVSRELKNMIDEAGFINAAYYGTYTKEPLSPDSPAIIVSAIK